MRCVRLGFLLLAMSLLVSARAEANIWDWLEELNGPGPSRSRGNFMVNVKCRVPSDAKDAAGNPLVLGKFQIPRIAETRATCLFVDLRQLHAEDDSRFYPVDLTITEVGTSVWLHPAVEVGAGIGAIVFNSRNLDTDAKYSGARMTVSFPRLVFRPLLALPYAKFQNDSRWGFFQIYFKESIIVGTLDQNDFASKPGNVFSRTHQRVESMGFIMDLTALLGRTK